MGGGDVGSNREGGGGLDSRLTVGAVLLAAGSGSRMGHKPKCLLQLEGVPLVRRQFVALADAGVQDIVVVLGHHAEHIEPAIRDLPALRVHNPDPDAGQVASLRLGLTSLARGIDAVLVALADQPLIGARDIEALIGAYRARPAGAEVVQPSVDGLPGNPVMFSPTVCKQILAGGPRMGCKEWQSAHPEAVHRWVTANANYRTDVDRPEDIEALVSRTGLRLVWPERW